MFSNCNFLKRINVLFSANQAKTDGLCRPKTKRIRKKERRKTFRRRKGKTKRKRCFESFFPVLRWLGYKMASVMPDPNKNMINFILLW